MEKLSKDQIKMITQLPIECLNLVKILEYCDYTTTHGDIIDGLISKAIASGIQIPEKLLEQLVQQFEFSDLTWYWISLCPNLSDEFMNKYAHKMYQPE